jgi:Zn-dependent M28 family amino/carboxypeptidase
VKVLPPEAKKKIRAMINLDCLGLGTTNVEFEPKYEELARLLKGVAVELHLPLDAVDGSRVGTSDHRSFARSGIPSIMIHSVTQDTRRTLHSIRDRMDAVRVDEYYDTYTLVTAFLTVLNTAVPE